MAAIPEYQTERYHQLCTGVQGLFGELLVIEKHLAKSQDDLKIFEKRYQALCSLYSKHKDCAFIDEFNSIIHFFEGWYVRFNNAFVMFSHMDHSVSLKPFFKKLDGYPGEEVLESFKRLQAITEVKDTSGKIIGKSKDLRRLKGHAKTILKRERNMVAITKREFPFF